MAAAVVGYRIVFDLRDEFLLDAGDLARLQFQGGRRWLAVTGSGRVGQ